MAVKTGSGKLLLPIAPASETGTVKAWEEPVVMRTYMPAEPNRNPLFLEKRVYQGSSGRVYPLPVIDRIATQPQQHEWKAVHLENEFLRLMVLPEIGGRIHLGLDKRNNYDFFYRQNVIKPALVGLAGPWASGGVEFNWPQHHRPATFMPVEVSIERDTDGAITVWCSDHDPMVRLKGMHGLCLRPGKAYLELRVRLYNRTLDTQSFLWWANVATHVNECYQSFFPKDVRFAADHAKRAITEYPLSQGTYYGIDYGDRALHGVPEKDKPAHFVPEGSYAANDLGWYANIPVPTSYMIVGTCGDFSGGYDHKRQAGTVAVANHHIAPGKKQWTWGNQEFGYAWDRNLTDSDGPYVELMAGVYTDNQPDFSFLAPGETKTFSQFWYPIGEIGVPDHANIDAALHVANEVDGIHIHLQVTSARPQSNLRIRIGRQEAGLWQGDLTPDVPVHISFPIEARGDLEITLEQAETVLLRYAPAEIRAVPSPAVATEPPLPEAVKNSDELFLTGLHLEQYRHPTRSPQDYWLEAIRRDAGDSRCTHAMGRWHLRRGELAEAERYLRLSIARLVERNPNPYDGEPHYNLGLALLYLNRTVEAYEAFYKSTWNAAWRGPAYHRLAEIDASRSEWGLALDHVERSLRADTDNLNARNLKAIVLRRLGRSRKADALLDETQALDPLDIFSRFIAQQEVPKGGQQRLDLALDLMRAGLLAEALEVLSEPHNGTKDGAIALSLYAKAHVLRVLGRGGEEATARAEAAMADSDYVFPSRIEEMLLLEEAIRLNPEDARAPYYLANLFYDRRRHKEAITLWERATDLDASFSIPWRNLGFGYFNVLHDTERALHAFRRARECAPHDARVLYEYDQLRKRTGEQGETRLEALEMHPELVVQRDELSVELASLYTDKGQPEHALQILLSRQFQPWEGGEGIVLAQYVRANVLLAQRTLRTGNALQALRHLQAAVDPPHNLSEVRHPLSNLSIVDYWFGAAYDANGEPHKAKEHWQNAANSRRDFLEMQMQPISDMTFWSAMSLQQLGRIEEALATFREINDYAVKLDQETPKLDYFATSLPAMLLFDEDLKKRQTVTALFLQAQAQLGLGESDRAAALLHQVRELDGSHTGAIDLQKLIEAGEVACIRPR